MVYNFRGIYYNTMGKTRRRIKKSLRNKKGRKSIRNKKGKRSIRRKSCKKMRGGKGNILDAFVTTLFIEIRNIIDEKTPEEIVEIVNDVILKTSFDPKDISMCNLNKLIKARLEKIKSETMTMRYNKVITFISPACNKILEKEQEQENDNDPFEYEKEQRLGLVGSPR